MPPTSHITNILTRNRRLIGNIPRSVTSLSAKSTAAVINSQNRHQYSTSSSSVVNNSLLTPSTAGGYAKDKGTHFMKHIETSISPYSLSFHSTPSIQQESKTVIEKIQTTFPTAYKSGDLVSKVQNILSSHGYKNETTLFATSLCCDEVNRELEVEFTNIYNYNFSMGGLAGFPFGGVTSFGAMAHHIPDDGSCFILYGPHVGIDLDGNVGKLHRRGRHNGSGACCGSAAAAYGYVKDVTENKSELKSIPNDDLPALDAQQTLVGNMLLPQGPRLLSADVDADVELPMALFDVQDDFMKKIVEKGCGEVAGDGKIALLGGVQINTPNGTSEYFLPKIFEIRNNQGELVADLMASL